MYSVYIGMYFVLVCNSLHATFLHPYFHFSVSGVLLHPCPFFLNLFFELDPYSNEYFLCTCKHRLRYSRERAVQNLLIPTPRPRGSHVSPRWELLAHDGGWEGDEEDSEEHADRTDQLSQKRSWVPRLAFQFWNKSNSDLCTFDLKFPNFQVILFSNFQNVQKY